MNFDYHVKLVTGPTAEPVSFADVQAQLRITATAEQSLIEDDIVVARDHAEKSTGRAFIDQTWDVFLDRFYSEIEIPKPPLDSVTRITYIDTDGNTATLATTVYQVDTSREPGRVLLADGQSWPDIDSAYANPVTIRFKAGYGTTAASVPAQCRKAIKLLTAHWYENRENTSEADQKPIPSGASALLSHYKVPTMRNYAR